VFQPEVKLKFIERYCNPHNGWTVYVDIDASEEGRTGGERENQASIARKSEMQTQAESVKDRLRRINVTIGGGLSNWIMDINGVPDIKGDPDIVAIHKGKNTIIIAETEGESSGQPEQKLYRAIGQIIKRLSGLNSDGWTIKYVLVVFGDKIEAHLREVKALERLGVSGVALNEHDYNQDAWVFGRMLSK